MKLRASVAILAFALALSACEEESASGIIVGPLPGSRVAESVLALAVIDGVPVGITDTFLPDELVNLWVHWEDLEPPHEAEAVWFDPAGDQVDFTVLNITRPEVEQITVFTLELITLSETGRWDVELYLDGEFQRSHTFLVVEFLP